MTPTLGPDASGVGWVLQYALVDRTNRTDLQQLRSLQDWHVRYALQSVPVTFTLKLAGGGPENNYSTNTDASGFFTITSPAGPGLYDWRVKNPQTLANSGSVTLPSSGTTQQEMGLLREGDANNDNCTSALDFNIVRSSFGKGVGDPGYDARADFNGDNIVNILDFGLQKNTFGLCGAGPITVGR